MVVRLPAPNKYHARAVVVDGRRFSSQAEANRAAELQLLEKAGKILMLTYQPRYPIDVRGQHVCTYVADFSYYDVANRRHVVEDIKGVRTAVYKLKARLVLAAYGFGITEIQA